MIRDYIPLERRIAFKNSKRNEKREWLERAHRLSPRCHYCKNVTRLMPRDYNMSMRSHEEFVATVDHYIPLAANGPDKPDNYRLACAICNALKANMDAADFIELLRVEGVRA